MPKVKGAASRSAEAYDRLREDLVSGALPPSTKLTLSELQGRYGLGAMPLREALNRLSAEHLVLKHDQRGFSVPPLDGAIFLEIQNARIVIEIAALRETMQTPTPAWEDRLVLAYHHLAKASKGPEYLLSQDWSDSHAAFHKALISGCDNGWLLTFAGQLYKQSARYRARRRQIDADRARGRNSLLAEHEGIMKAALSGSADTAATRLIEHYRRSVETVLGEPVELSPSQLKFVRSGTWRAAE